MNNLATKDIVVRSAKDVQIGNLKHIHENSKGIICIAKSNGDYWKQEYGNYKTLMKKITELEGYDEIFFSQNTLRKCKRNTDNLLEIKACYMDIDYYREKLTKEQALYGVQSLIEDGSIPAPTMIVDSGHGLYLIWRLKWLPPVALKLWRIIQEYLFIQLESIGADRSSIDPVRVLRLTGSLNAKNPRDKKTVQAISQLEIEYDLHDLQAWYLKDIKKPKKPSKTQRVRNRRVISLKNIYMLYCTRKSDILSLCKLRNYEMTGMREMVLFLYRYYSCLQYTEAKAVELVEELNSQFSEPCRMSTVLRVTRSAERAAAEERYNYKNSTLIELLDISEEEQRARYKDGNYILQTIISKEEKYRRKNQIRNDKRRNDNGLTRRQQEKKDRLEAVKYLKDSDYTQKEIMNELGMSESTVKRYYKMLNENN